MKKIKLALLTVALASSSMAVMAQDKATLIKQFIDIQRPGIESLARGLVEQSSAPIAQAGSQYLQTQVPEAKREAAAKAADAELKKYFDDAYPIVRDKAVQLLAWINSPLSKKYQDLNPKMQTALTEKLVADTRATIEPKMRALDENVAKALGAPTEAPAAKAPAKAPAKK